MAAFAKHQRRHQQRKKIIHARLHAVEVEEEVDTKLVSNSRVCAIIFNFVFFLLKTRFKFESAFLS